jgi:hypothetical protein
VRRVLLLGTLVAALVAPGLATAHPATHSAVAPACKKGYYRNVSGRCVHRPVHAAKAPAGATAKCVDGTWSFSQHARGTCSHHGGVARWIHHP